MRMKDFRSSHSEFFWFQHSLDLRHVMTPWHGNIFHITSPFVKGIHRSKMERSNDAEIWLFQHEEAIQQNSSFVDYQ